MSVTRILAAALVGVVIGSWPVARACVLSVLPTSKLALVSVESSRGGSSEEARWAEAATWVEAGAEGTLQFADGTSLHAVQR